MEVMDSITEEVAFSKGLRAGSSGQDVCSSGYSMNLCVEVFDFFIIHGFY